MFEIQDYVEDVKEKISKIPQFPRRNVLSLLEILPVTKGRRQQKIIEKINKLVESKYNSHVIRSKNPILSYPDKNESKGDNVILGHVCAGDQVLHPFELTMENLRENLFCISRSGHGKTSFVRYFVQSLVSCGINFVFWDWKQDYRSLAETFPDILVLKWSDLRYNPITNVPAGLDTKEWWRVLFTIFSHSFGVLIATPSFILESLEEIYEEKKGAVTFKDLYDHLRSQNEQTRKRAEYLDVAENRLYAVNQSLGNVINVKYGFDVSEIFKHRIVIELDPLDTQSASFIIQTLMMHEFYRRLRCQVRM